MIRINRSVISPYTPQQLYDLVNDVQSYPEFIPNCAQTRVVEQFEDGYVAEVELKLSGLRQKFATRNTTFPCERITMTLASGPFKKLNGSWVFEAIDSNGCRVTFELAYEFASKYLGKLIGPLFQQFTDKAVHAFIKRAKTVYGIKRFDSN